jgi:hypothetical protein
LAGAGRVDAKVFNGYAVPVGKDALPRDGRDVLAAFPPVDGVAGDAAVAGAGLDGVDVVGDLVAGEVGGHAKFAEAVGGGHGASSR